MIDQQALERILARARRAEDERQARGEPAARMATMEDLADVGFVMPRNPTRATAQWRWDPEEQMAVPVAPEPEREEVTGAMCEYCRTYNATQDGLCRNCLTCRMCGERTMTMDLLRIPGGVFRCAGCLCQGCKTPILTLRDEDGKGWCHPCFRRTHPDKLCGLCGENAANVIVRSQTKATVCHSCLRNYTPGRFISCYYCNGMALTVWMKYAVCDFHQTQTACGKNCNPGRQCGNCTMIVAQERIVRADRNAGRRQSVPHTDHDPKVFDMRNCQGCMWREGRGIFLPAPQEPTFWPEWVNPLKTTPPVLPMTKRRQNRSSRYISLEIEVAGVVDRNAAWQIAATIEKWGGSVVRDASLGEGGFEVNLSPSAGDLFVEQVTEIGKTIERVGGYVDERCGLHVHVNTRDFTYADMRRLLMLYGKLEPALLRTQPAARTFRGRYAVPCGRKYREGIPMLSQPKADKKTLVKSIYGIDMVRPLRHRNGHNREIEARYDFFNVHSWFYRGTVECRGHAGTVSARKMLPWGMLWASIVDSAYRMTEKTISSMGHDEESSINTLLTLAPTDYVRRYIANRLEQYKHEYEGSGF